MVIAFDGNEGTPHSMTLTEPDGSLVFDVLAAEDELPGSAQFAGRYGQSAATSPYQAATGHRPRHIHRDEGKQACVIATIAPLGWEAGLLCCMVCGAPGIVRPLRNIPTPCIETAWWVCMNADACRAEAGDSRPLWCARAST